MSGENVCSCGHHVREHKDGYATDEQLLTSAPPQKICSKSECSCTSFQSNPAKIETREPTKPVLPEKKDIGKLLETLKVSKADYDNDEIIQLLVDGHGEKYEIKNYRKVLIFSYFKDTVEWIHDYLVKEFKKDKKLAVYKNRFELITGSRTLSGKDKDDVISGFAPESTKAPLRNDLYDLIVCSDVLAEGLNLHQCRNIINYDLPWNPMRLVQRHGRIDRINSQYDQVYLKSFFPEKYTERLLRLVDRIRRKLAMAARTVGEEAPPIVGGEKGTQGFSDRIEIE